ncbi:mitogen-activated protein kinase kinase kinase 20-like [Curcuma longa]|uniref:mitogen-activated protein kinase kinase kinase 20-like n=1 Tax=Curcuma longa TaxID=136217 RepID=UPI003D9E7E96
MDRGMEWSRGPLVGRGSFATVSLAYIQEPAGRWGNIPDVVAVKTAVLSRSDVLRHERSMLAEFQGCPQIVRCFGDEVAVDEATGVESYNLFLEYAAGGSLFEAVRRSGRGLGEATVRRYARSILRGLEYVHARGYAHCDIKLHNILVRGGGGGGDNDVVIADFGLAKKAGGDNAGAGISGTPLYMAPETVAGGTGSTAAAADVWALGCAVAEMSSGRPAWGRRFINSWGLLFAIGFGEESPEIPAELSEEGRDFLNWCFVKDPARRWTAKMLLQHAFVAEEDDMNRSSQTDFQSPRSVFGLSEWPSPRSPSDRIHANATKSTETDRDPSFTSPADRVMEIAATAPPNWARSPSDGWINVRSSASGHQEQEQQQPVLRLHLSHSDQFNRYHVLQKTIQQDI